MSRIIAWLWVSLLLIGYAIPMFAQQSVAGSSSTVVVPPLVSFSGVLTNGNGQPLTGVVGVTFALYAEPQGGTPLWLETQNVYPGKTGQYTVMLGSTTSTGIPPQIFASGEARWLGVQSQGQPEQPRVSVLSVPYAMEAANAQTVGGLPASAFVLAAPPSSNGAKAASQSAARPLATGTTPVTTAGGTVNQVPLWDSTSDITSSVITQTGSGSTARVGINTTTPSTTLTVNGGLSASGFFIGNNHFAFGSYKASNAFLGFAGNSTTTGAGNTAVGYQGLFSNTTGGSNTASGDSALRGNTTGNYNTASGYVALSGNSGGGYNTANGAYSLYDNSTGADNTATGAWTLNNNNGSNNTATGMSALSDNSTGSYNTANGYEALGINTTGSNNTALGYAANVGSGSLTNATAIGANSLVSESNALVLGGTGSNAVNVGIGTTTPAYTLDVQGTGNFTGLVNFNSAQTFPGTGTITGVTAGTDLTGGGTSGNVTLNLNTAAVPQLNVANAFTGNQTVNGNLSATGVVTGSSYQIGSNLFAYGLYSNANVFLGFAGNGTATGDYNTASGWQALYINGSGSSNTANGYQALQINGSGSGNTAIGYQTLVSNGSGNYNTASGAYALYDNIGYGNTASGYQALYSNSTGYDNTASGYQALYSNSEAADNTASGAYALFSNDGYDNTAVGYEALYSNTGGAENTAVGYEALYSTTGTDLTCVGYECTADPDGLTNATAIGAHARVAQSNSLVLGGTGEHAVRVGIGTTAPSNILTIGRGTGHPVSDSWETYSSRRWKTNIHPLQNALSKVEQLRGVSYDLKDSGKHEIGVIAEEVGKVVPEVVSYEKNGKDARGVDYSRLTALLIEATKEQQALIRKQQQQIRTQQAQLKAQQTQGQLQQAQIAELMSQVKAIQASLKTNGRDGAEVRTVKARASIVQQ